VILTPNYDLANYLYYHLLADPVYRGREVYVVQHVGWDELRGYLAGRERLRQVEEGPPAGVPTGLPAFVASGAAEFQAAGFSLAEVSGTAMPLFRLAGPGDGAAARKQEGPPAGGPSGN
jgi:hypothetical protein